MDDFLIQFIAQAWRGLALIGGLLLIAFFVARRNASKKQEDIRRRKEAQNPQVAQKSSQRRSEKSPKKSQAKANLPKEQAEFAEELFADDIAESGVREDEFVISSKGSIFDDDEFFPEEEDSPAVSVKARTTQREEPLPPSDFVEDKDADDLASLLSEMVVEEAPAKNYHRVTEQLVSIKLKTNTLALGREILTILRDTRDSRLMVQIGDVAYRTLLGEKEGKALFTDTMRELSGIILTPDSNPPESVDITGIAPNMMSPQGVDVQVASGGDTNAREMISILRDEADGHLIIQIGNTGYRTLADNPKAKAGFSKIMKELSTVITTEDDNPPVVEEKPSVVEPTPVQPGSSLYDDDEEEVLPGDIRVASMDDLPDAYKVGRFGRVKINKIEDKVEEINIADAIESYLQYKIQQTPEFKNRGIHVRSAFGGGVRIEVEGKSYEYVDEVAEEDAREFIKKAIAEWQERH